MSEIANDAALKLAFEDARTFHGWQDKPVSDEQLKEIYELAKWGPTSANCCPMRLAFVTTDEAKQRLKPALAPGNVDQTMSAPVTVIVAHDMEFHEKLPELFPHTDAKSWFTGNEKMIAETAFRNGSLQGAYVMIAARLLGLDCGPMSGFDADKVNEEFLYGTNYRTNFLCNIGYGAPDSLHPRGPRLEFLDACEII